jgi:hypothetical protein
MMRKLALVLLVAPALAASSWTVPQNDVEGGEVALNQYFKGHETGRADVMAEAFHPEARLIWMGDEGVRIRALDDWLAGFNDTPAEDEDQRQRRIVSIDITGNTAIGKLELVYPDVTLIDYMTLLETTEGWKIVHKSFTRASS